jgi:hypothetical protein
MPEVVAYRTGNEPNSDGRGYQDSQHTAWIAAVGAEIAANPYAEKPPMLVELNYMKTLFAVEASPSIAIPTGTRFDELTAYAAGQARKIKITQDLLSDIETRLGSNFCGRFASLTDAQKLAFIERFEAANDTLPYRHPRHKYADKHHHDHSHDEIHSCRTVVPGIGTRAVSWLEANLAKRTASKTLRTALALGSRAVLFAFCPGDDLAALGMQTIGALKGHTERHGHQHQEVPGVLPGRPRIDFEIGKAVISLPADVPVRHDELPDTPAGKILREHTLNPEASPGLPHRKPLRVPAPTQKLPEVRKPGKRFRLRAAAAGSAAMIGILAGDAKQQDSVCAQQAAERLPASQPNESPSAPQDQYHSEPLTECVMVAKGDSQWSLAEKRIREVTGKKTNAAITNVVTTISIASNKTSNPNPRLIYPGQCLQMPMPSTIKNIYEALTRPANSCRMGRLSAT